MAANSFWWSVVHSHIATVCFVFYVLIVDAILLDERSAGQRSQYTVFLSFCEVIRNYEWNAGGWVTWVIMILARLRRDIDLEWNFVADIF